MKLDVKVTLKEGDKAVDGFNPFHMRVDMPEVEDLDNLPLLFPGLNDYFCRMANEEWFKDIFGPHAYIKSTNSEFSATVSDSKGHKSFLTPGAEQDSESSGECLKHNTLPQDNQQMSQPKSQNQND